MRNLNQKLQKYLFDDKVSIKNLDTNNRKVVGISYKKIVIHYIDYVPLNSV